MLVCLTVPLDGGHWPALAHLHFSTSLMLNPIKCDSILQARIQSRDSFPLTALSFADFSTLSVGRRMEDERAGVGVDDGPVSLSVVARSAALPPSLASSTHSSTKCLRSDCLFTSIPLSAQPHPKTIANFGPVTGRSPEALISVSGHLFSSD